MLKMLIKFQCLGLTLAVFDVTVGYQIIGAYHIILMAYRICLRRRPFITRPFNETGQDFTIKHYFLSLALE